MPYFIRTDRDPDGTQVRVENAFKAESGRYFLLVHRPATEYTSPSTFVLELSGERVDRRGAEDDRSYFKAFAHEDFTAKEIEFLAKCQRGRSAMPFFNMSYPHVIKIIGKRFDTLGDSEIRQLVENRYWKLIGGMR